MKDEEKTKEQLINELVELRERFAKMEKSKTERERVEEALLEAHVKLKKTKEYQETLIKDSPDPIISTDHEGNVVLFNEGAEDMLGYQQDEVIGQYVAVLYENEEQAKEVMRLMRQNSGTVAGFETTLRAKDGNLIPVMISASILYDEEGNETGTVGFNKDLRERKRVEERLKSQNEFVRNVLESLNHPFYVIDANDYTIEIANSAARAKYGGGVTDKLTCYVLTHNNSEPCGNLGERCPLEEVKRTKEAVTLEHVHFDKEGNARIFEVHGHPVFDSEGNVTQMIEYSLDITERKQAEERSRESHLELQKAYSTLERTQASAIAAEKLAALGQLTAGVSHEILNPLNVISMRLYMMLNDPSTPPEMLSHLNTLNEQTERITKITQDLLSYARQRPKERHLLDFNETVISTLSLLEYDLRKDNITVELQLTKGLSPVLADQDQLQQVVLNLLKNAHNAMPDGGRLIISSDEVNVGGQWFAECRTEDTGVGIASEHLDNLFDPFFTTKPEGEGTGLGLSICKGIIESHDGSIWAESEEGRGTTLIIQMPLVLVQEGIS